jgi:ribosomal protein S12 methylthiotransferase
VKVCHHIEWVRLLYAFPAHVTDDLIDTIAREEKICKYIDIPLQHISDHLLSSMNRNITTQQTKELMEKFRTRIPSGSLRTTFIVGLPTETEEDFSELLAFVSKTRFEKLGTFVYSREEGTAAYAMPMQVPETVKKKRLKEIMGLQQEISREIQQGFVGRELKVLVDEIQNAHSGVYLGRSEYDAPEVDGIVYVHSKRRLRPGEFVQVRIKDAYEYDLSGDVV